MPLKRIRPIYREHEEFVYKVYKNYVLRVKKDADIFTNTVIETLSVSNDEYKKLKKSKVILKRSFLFAYWDNMYKISKAINPLPRSISLK